MRAFTVVLLILLLPAAGMAQTPVARTVHIPTKPLPAPESFAQALLRIEGLEQDIRFDEALALCSEALAQYTAPAQRTLLEGVAARLAHKRKKAHEISFALRSLADGREHDLEEARETLRSAAEVSRLYLRKAVREGNDATLEEAGTVLMEMGDPAVAGLLVDRWTRHHTGSTAPVILELLERIKNELSYDHVAKLCATANARPEIMRVVLDALEASVTPPFPPADAKQKDAGPALRNLASRMDARQQELVVKALITFIEKHPTPAPSEKATMERVECMLARGGFPHAPGLLVDLATRKRSDPAAVRPLQVLKRMPGNSLDTGVLKSLLSLVEQHGHTEDAAADLVLDALENTAGIDVRKRSSDDRIGTALGRLQSRLNLELQTTAVRVLLHRREKRAQGNSDADKAAADRIEAILLHSRLPQTPRVVISKLTRSPGKAVPAWHTTLLRKVVDSVDRESAAELARCVAAKDLNSSAAASVLLDWLEYRAVPVASDGRADRRSSPKLVTLSSRLDGSLQHVMLTSLLAFVERLAAAPSPTEEEKKDLERAVKIIAESRFHNSHRELISKLSGKPADAFADRLVALLEASRSGMGELDSGQQSGMLTGLIPFIEKRAVPGRSDEKKKGIERAERILREGRLTHMPALMVEKLYSAPSSAAAPYLVRGLATMTGRIEALDSGRQSRFVQGLLGFIQTRNDSDSSDPEGSFALAENMLVGCRYASTPHLVVDRFTTSDRRLRPSDAFAEKLVQLLLRMKDRLAALDTHRRGNMVKALVTFMSRREDPKAGKEQKAAVENAEAILLECGLAEVPKTLIASLQGTPSDKAANRLVRILEKRKHDLVKADDGTKSALAKGMLAYMERRIGSEPKPEQDTDLERAEKLLLDTRHPQTYNLVSARFSSGSRPSPELAVHLVRILDQVRTDLSRLDANRRAQLIRNLLHFMELWTRPDTPGEQQDVMPLVDRVLQESNLPEALASMVKALKTAKSDPFADHLVMLIEAKKGSLSALDANTQSLLILGLLDFMEKRLAPNATPEQKRHADRAKAILVESKLEKVHSVLLGKLRREPAEPFTRRLVEILKALRDQTDEKTYRSIKSLASREGPNKPLLTDLVNHLKSKFPDKK